MGNRSADRCVVRRLRDNAGKPPKLMESAPAGIRRSGLAPRTEAAAARVPRPAAVANSSSAATPRVVYELAFRRWWLVWPCETCGGVKLPLRSGHSAEGPSAGRLPLRPGVQAQPRAACAR